MDGGGRWGRTYVPISSTERKQTIAFRVHSKVGIAIACMLGVSLI
jgi:hypothetical protein